MNTNDSLSCSKHDLNVAVIGDFQVGKSTFVNCLIERNDAAIGKGVTTTHRSTAYLIGNGVSVIDTPGFNAPGDAGREDAQAAREAIRRSFVVVVYLDRMMGDVCRSLVREAMSHGKRCVFVYNSRNPEKWSPDESEDIRCNIEAEVKNLGCSDTIVKLGEALVHSINAQWALFGLGLLDDEKVERKISHYAYDELKMAQGVDLKAELLCRSRILEIKRFIMDLPLEVISNFLNNPNREIAHVVDRFYDALSKRLAEKEVA